MLKSLALCMWKPFTSNSGSMANKFGRKQPSVAEEPGPVCCTAAEPAFYYPSTWDPHFTTTAHEARYDLAPGHKAVALCQLPGFSPFLLLILFFYSISAGVFIVNTNRSVMSTFKHIRLAWVGFLGEILGTFRKTVVGTFSPWQSMGGR